MADDQLTTLELGKSYFFQVIYYEGETGYAGTLELSPEKIRFKVVTERPLELSMSTTEAQCEATPYFFILRGMRCIKSRQQKINYIPHVGLIEMEFDVEYLIFHQSTNITWEPYDVLSIHSTTVNEWIGHTTTQDKILEANYIGEDTSPLSNELFVETGENEGVGVGYGYSRTISPLSYQDSFVFKPYLYFVLGADPYREKPFELYIKAYNFLAFVAGHEPQVQQVLLEYNCRGKTYDASLYFCDRHSRFRPKGAFIFFPLGINSRFDHWGIPPLPEKAFLSYFSVDSQLPDIFSKYNTYRNMGNVEDRLLGYFRLLEKHCYKEKPHLEDKAFEDFSTCTKKWMIANGYTKSQIRNFTSGLKRFNRSKYNTEKCVTDYYKSLPDSIRNGLKLRVEEIKDICDLRNNITHANPYQIESHELYHLTANIHDLLILALLVKLEIPLDKFSALTSRLLGS